jgi:metallo-beta-lactamase family protein
MLFELHKLYEEKVIKDVSVFLDSPLAIKLTSLYEKILGENIFNFPMLRETASARDSKQIWEVKGPKIILAGSGMSTAGRILFHEERYLPDPNAIILFVGFQAPGTLGRQIQEGMKEVVIDDAKVPVRAEVISINGYSAHAGSDQLVDFVSHSKDTLERVFVAMGEPKSSIFLAQRLHDELGVEAVVPERGKKYELDL